MMSLTGKSRGAFGVLVMLSAAITFSTFAYEAHAQMYNTSQAAKGVAGDHNFSTIRNELDEAISIISGRLNNNDDEIDDLRKELENLRRALEELRSKLERLQSDVTNIQTELKDLRKDVANLKSELSNFKKVVNANFSDLRTQISMVVNKINSHTHDGTGENDGPAGGISGGMCPDGQIMTGISSAGQPYCQGQTAGVISGTCAAGKVMVGIRNGRIVCRNKEAVAELAGVCADGKVMSGVRNGRIVCLEPGAQQIAGSCPAGQAVTGVEGGRVLCGPQAAGGTSGSCPEGEVVTGVMDGQVVCGEQVGDKITGSCPAGQVVTGVEDGELLCGPQVADKTCPCGPCTRTRVQGGYFPWGSNEFVVSQYSPSTRTQICTVDGWHTLSITKPNKEYGGVGGGAAGGDL